MTYVVTESCIRCKYTDCVDVCPVDCFREGPNMLVIDPDECIDCAVCIPECPVEAIKAEEDVPADMQEQSKAALLERDAAKRSEMYGDLQRKVREQGPFAMLWQQTEVAGLRKNVQGYKLGPTFDTNFLAPVSK